MTMYVTSFVAVWKTPLSAGFLKSNFKISLKEDNSPLTIADKNSNQIICSELKKSHPQIPILSEEGASIPYSGRKDWGKFWLIDPIDGTKEFIKKKEKPYKYACLFFRQEIWS